MNNNFEPIRHILTIPGNEKVPLGNDDLYTQYIDHIVGKKTLWDFDGEGFYYLSTNSSKKHKYNLRTRESQTNIYFDLERRLVTKKIHRQLIEYLSSLSIRFPTIKEVVSIDDQTGELRFLKILSEIHRIKTDLDNSYGKETDKEGSFSVKSIEFMKKYD